MFFLKKERIFNEILNFLFYKVLFFYFLFLTSLKFSFLIF